MRAGSGTPRVFPAALAAAGVLALAGCGYIGEPLPPLLNIPARVTDLAAVERGGHIIVQFSLPRLSTEGAVLRRPPELDLRAGPAAAPFDADAWAAGAQRFQQPPITKDRVRYELPVNGWPGKEIIIGVRAIGAKGRDAGWSNFAVLAVVPPPVRPTDLRAEAVPEGVRLTWVGQGALYRVWRRGPGEQAFTPVGDTGQPAWTDARTVYGSTYEYLVQAIVKTASGVAESENSAETRITPADRFPPAVPTGLAAVASTGSLELVWDRNTEPDFAAYRVYRATAGGPFVRIAETGATPSYSDRAVEAGKTYRYAVAAVDTSGNESKLSEPVEVTAP